ncbi:MAG: DUF29 domain-containing protein [Microcystaceae cyanobacterium]
MTITAPPVSLYEQDLLLWTEETIRHLEAKNFEELDLDNLIEEIVALGRSERKELKSRLLVLFEHLLKRLYVPIPLEYNGWERTIREQRIQLELVLEVSPSLKHQWQESCEQAWRLALKKVKGDYPDTESPNTIPFSTERLTLLNQDFWQS